MKPLILVTNRFDHQLKLSLPQISEGDFRYCADLFSDETLLSKVQGLIVRSSTKIDRDFLNKAPDLKFLITATSGFDHIDLKAAKEKGLKVYHVPESQILAAAELTLSFIILSQRKWTLAQSQMQKGDWQRSLLLGKQIQGQKLGIIGLGRVGKKVAELASSIGLEVYGFDPFLTEAPENIQMRGFEELMRTVDIVSLHVPKTKSTRHMIKKESLEWIDSEGTLINMSRGDVINEVDLIEHLLENPGFSAALDVFAREPLVKKSRLFELPNVILSPHIGASTQEALRQSSQGALDLMLQLLAGESPENGLLPPQAPWYEPID